MANMLTRALSRLTSRPLQGEILERQVEGEPRPGPWYLPITGGWLPADWGSFINWWQMGRDVIQPGPNAMVESCVGAYAQTTAMCPGDHWRSLDNGGRERVTNSALSRLMRRPNAYQSPSDFMLNLVWHLQGTGNAYALAIRNDRFEVAELHLMNPHVSHARVAFDGSVFYDLSGNEVIERQIGVFNESFMVPARDVLHLRLKTPRHPLVGESPLHAAVLQMSMGNMALQQQVTFYLNQARPSFVLTTDRVLNQDQVDTLRRKWNEQSRGMMTGGTPILTAGLKPETLSVNARDGQLADLLKLNDQAIANVYRVPLQILGIGGTPFASTEALMNFWLAGALGFVLNHIEEGYGRFFGLRGVPDEYLELDTRALMRSAFTERVQGLVAAIGGGLLTINEARAEESRPSKPGGDDIRVQQQDVPLDWHENQPGPQAPTPEPEPEPEEPEPEEEAQVAADVQKLNEYAAQGIVSDFRHARGDGRAEEPDGGIGADHFPV